MLVRNENDVLAQVLKEHLRLVDHVYILDGTTEGADEARRICQELGGDCVSFYREDELPAHYPRPIKDGCRQFLVERARADYGCTGWFVLLHGDEIFVDAPADIVAVAKPDVDIIEVESLLFFLHRSQEPFVFRPGTALAEQICWYSGPGYPEVRLVRNRPDCNYDPGQHSDLVPNGLSGRLRTSFKIRHYPYRAVDQQRRRAEDRTNVTGFSPGTYQHVIAGRYYLDHTFFHYRHLYAWVSQRPPRPRAKTWGLIRRCQDILDQYTWRRIR
jgi:hypothetical protein